MIDIRIGDMRVSLDAMAANSIDSCVTDPPYHLLSTVKRFAKTGGADRKLPVKHHQFHRLSKGFMGQTWDGGDIAFQPETWAKVLRVLKPGAHLLAFAASKNAHRLFCAVEDAGFEIRDTIMWLYGSGFPKSHNLEGEWGGWGTALKPAYEPIVVARKPLIGTVAANVMAHGVGALNVDGCRVGTDENRSRDNSKCAPDSFFGGKARINQVIDNAGRWPANVIHDGSDEVLAGFPDAKGQQGVTGRRSQGAVYGAVTATGEGVAPRGDEGSAARFFYCAKASKSDRDEGLESFEPRRHSAMGYERGLGDAGEGMFKDRNPQKRNPHPTVKPTDLMRYLCRLVTPPNGVILDPFMGSGSTGKAAMLEGFRFIGCEMKEDYAEIARARIGAAMASAYEDALQ